MEVPYKLIHSIWNNGQLPQHQKYSITVPIYKNRDTNAG
jgi:hypothetical protein